MKKLFFKTALIISAFSILAATLGACSKKGEIININAEGNNSSSLSDAEQTSDEKAKDETTKKGETTKPGETTNKDDKNDKDKKTTAAEEKNQNKPSQQNGNTQSGGKNITLTGGLNSTSVSEVLKYYKLVAKKNADIKAKSKLSLAYLNVGTLIIDGESDSPNREKGLSFFRKAADFALGMAGTRYPFPGNPSAIKESDWLSAKAVNDGTYTTVTVNVKPQTDSYNGKEYEGSVGRSMQVLSGFDTALKSINDFPLISMTADFANSDVKIEYQNPTIKIKVNNATGELVKDNCKWSYRTKIYLNKLEGTMKVTKNHTVTIKNSNGAVDYSVNY